MRRLMMVVFCLCGVSPLFGANLLVNPGFETGDTTGWGARFGAGNVEAITDNPHSGNYCGRDYNRDATWHGIWQSQNMRDVTEAGVTYPVSIWVRTDQATPVNVAVTMQYSDPAPGSNEYHQITNANIGTEWTLLEAEYTMLDNESATATFYLEAPGSTDCEIYVDDAMFGFDEEADGLPYAPQAGPDPFDTGLVGTPVDSGGGVWKIYDVVLSFKASHDPDEVYEVNPAIVKHYIRLQTGLPNDPNLILIDYELPQLSLTDPNQSLALADVTPPVVLEQGTTYKWQVEEVTNYGSGNPGDPNNILGSVWEFTTANAVPRIMSISDHMLVDANGNAEFTIQTTASANNYRWYKVVGEVDSDENGETDDEMLTDSGIYSDTTTKTLKITGAAANGSEDSLIYAKAFNGLPGEPGTEVSLPSAARWFWAPNLMSYYTFETVIPGGYEGSDVTTGDGPGAVRAYQMIMASNDTGLDVPSQDTNVPPTPGIAGNGYSLYLDNPRANPADPNQVDAQYAQVVEPWAGGYKDITISTWVYSNGGSNWNRILDFGNDNANYAFLCINPGSVNRAVRFAVNVAGTEQTVTTPEGAIPDNEWTHITATLKDNTARIYINGELVVTNTSLTNNPVSFGPTVNNWIGRSQWGQGDGYFNGLIDELRIYNYALPTVEVGKLYLSDTLQEYVCNFEVYDLQNYDTNNNCLLDLGDFASMAARWLEDDRIYLVP